MVFILTLVFLSLVFYGGSQQVLDSVVPENSDAVVSGTFLYTIKNNEKFDGLDSFNLIYRGNDKFLVSGEEVLNNSGYEGFVFAKACFGDGSDGSCKTDNSIKLNDFFPIPTNPQFKNLLVYPKYNIEVPIVNTECEDFYNDCDEENPDEPVDTDRSNSPLQRKLESGLIHLFESPNPGEVGNAYIMGHSSNYNTIKSPYNEVLAPLEKTTQNGEIFYIYDQFGRKLKFEVFENIEVWRNEVDKAYYPEKENPDLENKRMATIQTSILVNGVPSKRWLTRGELVLD